MGEADFYLPIEGAYDLDRTLGVLTMGRGNPCLRHTGRAAAMTLATPAGPVAVLVERCGGGGVAGRDGNSSDGGVGGGGGGTSSSDRLRVAATGPGAGWVEPCLPAMLGLRDDPSGLVARAVAGGGKLGRLAKTHAGVRLPTVPVVFHRLVQVVLQQLITFRDACRGWRQLVQTHGEPVDAAGLADAMAAGGGGADQPTAALLDGLMHAPPAERIARLSTSELVACDILPRHARLIRELARQAAGLERLWGAGRDAGAAGRLSRYLIRQPGVGPWTVGYLGGAGLGDADAVVPGDYGHPHHVAYFFTGAERAAADAAAAGAKTSASRDQKAALQQACDREMLRLLEPYRPHRFRTLLLLILGAPAPPRRGPRRGPLRRRMR